MQHLAEVAISPATIAVTCVGLFLIAFTKGAFGGGFATIGIPLLALVMDPLTAGVLLAPLFILMDICALRYLKPSTWSKPDLLLLLPALLVGIAVGAFTLQFLDPRAFAITMALMTLTFVGLWIRGGSAVLPVPRSRLKARACGFGSGITSMVAHTGGPPLAMYLLPLGLAKDVYAGTTSIVFTVANAVKVLPWLWLVKPSGQVWLLMAICLPVIPFGVWAGWKLNQRLDQRQLYRACYALLVITSLKLLWDGVSGYLH
jgi:uncharacterized protein